MKTIFQILLLNLLPFVSYSQQTLQTTVITKGNVNYDFSFAELAIQYLEKKDTIYLIKISNLKATEHLLNHANKFNYPVPKESRLELVKFLLTQIENKKETLLAFKTNLNYAKEHIATVDFPQKECLKYLPYNFKYSSNLFFTIGYDIGVVYDQNASINLAHKHFINHTDEIKYYSIHELHHAGFVKLKNKLMPSLDVSNYLEMTNLIAYYTHLEGMGTYAPLSIRRFENGLSFDEDYKIIDNKELLRSYEKEFIEIYLHFANNPDKKITEEDWDKINVLSDGKRLWYRVGSLIAERIDQKYGRKKLTDLISEPSINFITTYLSIRNE